MTNLELAILGSEPAFEPGADTTVSVLWSLDAQPESIELRLYWLTTGKGDTDSAEHDVWTLYPDANEGESTVSIQLPVAPCSYAGRLIAIDWELEAVALPSKLHVTLPIVIGPGRQPIGGEAG